MSAPLVTPTDPQGRCQPPATARSHTSCRWRCTRDSRRRGGRRGTSRKVRPRWRAWSRSRSGEKPTASSSSTTPEIHSRRRQPRHEESAALRRSVKASGCEANGSVGGRHRPHRPTSTTDPRGTGQGAATDMRRSMPPMCAAILRHNCAGVAAGNISQGEGFKPDSTTVPAAERRSGLILSPVSSAGVAEVLR